MVKQCQNSLNLSICIICIIISAFRGFYFQHLMTHNIYYVNDCHILGYVVCFVGVLGFIWVESGVKKCGNGFIWCENVLQIWSVYGKRD